MKIKWKNSRLPSKAENTQAISNKAATIDNRWKDTVELSEPSPIQYAQRHTEAIPRPHHVNRSARQVRYLARHFGFYFVHVKHVANRPSYTEQSDTRQTGRLKATNRSAQDIRSDSRRRVKAETSATPDVAWKVWSTASQSTYNDTCMWICDRHTGDLLVELQCGTQWSRTMLRYDD